MSIISYAELDQLTGELLPERAVLSTMTPIYGGSSGWGVDPTMIASACQNVNNPGTVGLLGILGSTAPFSSNSCVPATIVTG